jgi:hypothetical protein
MKGAYEAIEAATDALNRGFSHVLDQKVGAAGGESWADVALEAIKEEIEQILADAASAVRDVAEEYRESADTIRESFSESPTADECEEKAEALEAYADELESISVDIPVPSHSDDDEERGEDGDDCATSNYFEESADAMREEAVSVLADQSF